MTIGESSKELFDFEVKQYSFLTALGFRRTDKSDEVRFASDLLVFVISLQRWGEPASTQLQDCTAGVELPSPLTALQYFLNDYRDQWNSIIVNFRHLSGLRASIATVAELCRRNPWVFTSKEWTRTPAFLKAIEETQKWFLSTTPLPSAEDVLDKLQSFRQL